MTYLYILFYNGLGIGTPRLKIFVRKWGKVNRGERVYKKQSSNTDPADTTRSGLHYEKICGGWGF